MNEWELYSDHELWVSFKTGKSEALSTLFVRFYEKLFRYGMNVVRCEDTVKDAIQRLFYNLWKKRQKVSVPISIDAYLYTSLRRILLRQKERRLALKQRHDVYIQQSQLEVQTVETRIILQEEEIRKKSLLSKALNQLSSREREALLLRLDSGLSNEEIAEVMEVTNKSIRNLICEAIKKIRSHLFNSQGR
jgi:RNA polymerase sigma factor (sigma-70 family)